MKNEKTFNIIFLFCLLVICFEIYIKIIDNKDKLQVRPVINNNTTLIETKSVSSIYEEVKKINGFKIISINKVDYVYYIDVEVDMDINQLKETLDKLLNYKVTSYDINIIDSIVSGKIQIAYIYN